MYVYSVFGGVFQLFLSSTLSSAILLMCMKGIHVFSTSVRGVRKLTFNSSERAPYVPLYCNEGKLLGESRCVVYENGNKVPSNSINPLYPCSSDILFEYDVDFDDYIILSVTVAVVLYFI